MAGAGGAAPANLTPDPDALHSRLVVVLVILLAIQAVLATGGWD